MFCICWHGEITGRTPDKTELQGIQFIWYIEDHMFWMVYQKYNHGVICIQCGHNLSQIQVSARLVVLVISHDFHHDDVIKWKHFPRYWPLVRGIHRPPVNSPHKRPVTPSFDVFFDLRLNKRLSKQSWGWWLKTLSCPLWRHRNDKLQQAPYTNTVYHSDRRMCINGCQVQQK